MIAVIDYGAGNTFNVLYALAQLGAAPLLTANEAELRNADKIIFPGVGHATHALAQLEQKKLLQVIPQLQQPVLGICLGMQLLFESSQESPLPALHIVDGQVKKFQLQIPVPHMGWNNVQTKEPHPLFNGIAQEDFYFVHSYYAPVIAHTIATTNYGHDFCAAVQHHNFYGTQFHPEKSGNAGLTLLENFLKL
jgi:imidazole glycerol-phosphate synthase subunit HisH